MALAIHVPDSGLRFRFLVPGAGAMALGPCLVSGFPFLFPIPGSGLDLLLPTLRITSRYGGLRSNTEVDCFTAFTTEADRPIEQIGLGEAH